MRKHVRREMLEKVKGQNTQMRKSITQKRLRQAMLEKVEGQKTQTRKASDAGVLAHLYPSRSVWYMSRRRIYKRTLGGVQPRVRGMGLGVPLN